MFSTSLGKERIKIIVQMDAVFNNSLALKNKERMKEFDRSYGLMPGQRRFWVGSFFIFVLYEKSMTPKQSMLYMRHVSFFL